MLDINVTYFKYILNYLWLFLADNEDVRSTHRVICIVATNIGNICARNTYIGSICAIDTWIRCADVKGAYIRGM